VQGHRTELVQSVELERHPMRSEGRVISCQTAS
jgi:hypothetical protein